MSYKLSTPVSWGRTMQDLAETFRLWGVKEWDVLMPLAKVSVRNTAKNPEVTLMYTKDGRQVSLEMSKQERREDNLRVLYLAVEAMRLNEKRGIGELVANAYLQLQAPEQAFNPYEVLGLPEGTPLSVCEAMYKELAKKEHPDNGGDSERFKKLADAIEALRKGGI